MLTNKAEKMKQSRYTPEQIIYALEQVGAGEKVSAICRKTGVSEARLYNRRKK